LKSLDPKDTATHEFITLVNDTIKSHDAAKRDMERFKQLLTRENITTLLTQAEEELRQMLSNNNTNQQLSPFERLFEPVATDFYQQRIESALLIIRDVLNAQNDNSTTRYAQLFAMVRVGELYVKVSHSPYSQHHTGPTLSATLIDMRNKIVHRMKPRSEAIQAIVQDYLTKTMPKAIQSEFNGSRVKIIKSWQFMYMKLKQMKKRMKERSSGNNPLIPLIRLARLFIALDFGEWCKTLVKRYHSLNENIINTFKAMITTRNKLAHGKITDFRPPSLTRIEDTLKAIAVMSSPKITDTVTKNTDTTQIQQAMQTSVTACS